jgi:hypothetical protein
VFGRKNGIDVKRVVKSRRDSNPLFRASEGVYFGDIDVREMIVPEYEFFLGLLEVSIGVIKHGEVGHQLLIREDGVRVDVRERAVPHFAVGR